jgi:CHAT domain-containing protein
MPSIRPATRGWENLREWLDPQVTPNRWAWPTKQEWRICLGWALRGRRLGQSIRLGFRALASTVREEDWSHYEIAHFGVHALLNPERPAFSGVVLTMVHPDGVPRNGVLWLSDIYTLHMPVKLVVLSGCRTANGREIPGEGLEGLSHAFFFAGARSVVGSLWSVEDSETGLLMQGFYRNLIHGKLSPAAALRRAQLAIAGQAGTSAPFHWAGFTIQGDGAAPLTSSSSP